MINSPLLEPVATHHRDAVEELAWAIAASEGQFLLMLAHCNYAKWRKRVVRRLHKISSVPIREVFLDQSACTLYTTLRQEIGEEQPAALMVFGLESVTDLDELLIATNQVREEFRKNFQFPLVLWINDEVLCKLIRITPDFHSWATTVMFEIPTSRLIRNLQQKANSLFTKVLELGASEIFPNDAILGAGYTTEIKFALRDLESGNHELPPELLASLNFVWGREAYGLGKIDVAITHYQKSLEFWQQEPRKQESKPENNGEILPGLGLPTFISRKPITPPRRERQAVILFHLGLCYCDQAKQYPPGDPSYRENWHKAKEYLEQCMVVFEQEQRPDLVAKLINQLGEILQSLEAWDDLASLATKSLALHRTYSAPVQLAQDYGFIAKVALHKSRWQEAYTNAIYANVIITKVTEEQGVAHHREDLLAYAAEGRGGSKKLSYYPPSIQAQEQQQYPSYQENSALSCLNGVVKIDKQIINKYTNKSPVGRYLLLLAQAQQHLGQHSEAISHLERARELGIQDDPKLYLEILETLGTLYWQQKRYQAAFRLKQERLAIAQQNGLLAFIGAGKLKSSQQNQLAQNQLPQNHLAQTKSKGSATVYQAMTASDWQHKVKELVQRIASTQHKLTVIYGQAGVGKSSLLEAGLIPALKQQPIGNRNVVPIRLKVYTDWVTELGQRILESKGEGYSPLKVESLKVEGLKVEGLKVEGYKNNFELVTILDQLQKNQRRNQINILIFDQFEEFFFACREPAEQKRFFEFFRDCLNIPYLKVILCLREDYLHLLLKCARQVDLDAINNDILNKGILYYVGNFSPDEAKSIIYNLTTKAKFYLEDALLDELVNDLAKNEPVGEVSPIELQIVGVQLQTEQITTLAAYRQNGSKEKLVERYLEGVVSDCGSENQNAAWKILGLLTDKHGTRPFRTKDDLGAELQLSTDQLDFILELLVKSGLVMKWQQEPEAQYQLMYDYLVEPIRRRC
ncbi:MULTISPECIES: tetratricopeptide repeat protein [unclassified Moorena]|uniref:nSTAND1 domain-containing NTPase n=1 Tax=unclassified Moorena TaxID=2683338 RepID=UPI0013BD9D28|nr:MULTISPECIES: tetratricopeptide repeat protein [unclassified Moorena]NEQ07307.1 tetratricopeptide repeat protein [Moorena sp. SIO4E2]NES43940.1 tetratricopeptide repeat protein [Moorena sp. SIO2C4]